MNASHAIETPSGAGAIAMIHARSDDLDALLELLGIRELPIGSVRLCQLLGIDSGVVTRWSADSIMLMPHGGQAVVRAISERLSELSVPLARQSNEVFPEAASDIESRMLDTLARAASPLAVDLLLDQPKRWREKHDEFADAAQLRRLIEPPIVVAVGRANIGKSSLLNAIAGSRVVLVADQAGTTRDHVGVAVDLAGLVVHWVDTPGIDERVANDEAVTIAIEMVRSAGLVLHCVDGADPSDELDVRLTAAIDEATPIVRVLTRVDLSEEQIPGLRTSATTGFGLAELVIALRDRLVPAEIIADQRPWRFWQA